jgi:hypothetical protein
MSYREVAAQMGLAVSTVQAHVYQERRRIRLAAVPVEDPAVTPGLPLPRLAELLVRAQPGHPEEQADRLQWLLRWDIDQDEAWRAICDARDALGVDGVRQ